MEGRYGLSLMYAESEVIMNISYSTYKAGPRRIRLARAEAIAIEARAGTELRSLDGTIWVTQDGDAQDYIVPAGVRFATKGDGRLVVTAMDGAAQVAVSWHAPDTPAGLFRGRISLDYERVAELKRAARTARAREIARLFACGWEWLVGTWCRLVTGNGTSRQAVAARSPRACHP